ncbi:MAG: hypothetical protein IBX44_09680 [Sulfurospirillum sp.]|nr:hypothetical protein [Sulfurospirillum sp.]
MQFFLLASLLESFEELIKNADFAYIFLSCNDEGFMGVQKIQSMMQKYGKYTLFKTDYRRFAIHQKHTKNTTNECLHVIKK